MKTNPSKPVLPNAKLRTPALAGGAREVESNRHVLCLYIADKTPKSVVAITNIKKICEENLKGRYELQVIDLYQQPQLAQGEQIIAVPTLIRELPPPLRRIIGDMSNTERVLVGLDLKKKT